MRTCVTVHDSQNAGGSSVTNEGPGVVFRVSRVDDDRFAQVGSERNLRRERGALGFAWRIVVMIVESALADGHSGTTEQLAQFRDIARRVEGGCIVRMDSGSSKHETRVVCRILRSARRRSERFPDADDRPRARLAGARDYRVAVAGERRVREVGVAVDEDCRALVGRGHLRSIQRRTGAAT